MENRNQDFGVKEEVEDDRERRVTESSSSESSVFGDGVEESFSDGSRSSSEILVEDASYSTSTSSSPSSSSSFGPLFELSELMARLPLKRGLSKYYEGKSQSYTSLASVRSVEDLAKKERADQIRWKKKKMMMNSCKSYGGGLDYVQKLCHSPKPTIYKKPSSNIASRPSFITVSVCSDRPCVALNGNSRPSLHVEGNF